MDKTKKIKVPVPPARPRATHADQKRHDWLTLEARWISGEWATLKQMAKAVGISERMIQKNSGLRKWAEKRQAVESEASEMARARAVKGLASRLIEANERALKTAGMVLKLGLQRFVDKRGRVRKDAIDSDATALHAIKSAIQIEQAVLRRMPMDEGAPGEGPIIPADPSGMEDLSDAELTRIARATAQTIAQIDAIPAPARARKSSRRGAKKKARGKN